jgi:type IV secretion system protein VirB10
LEATNALDSPDEVVGERGIPSVSQERSLQTRIHHALAIGLVLLVGGGFLTWYYAHLASQHRDEQAAKDPRVEAKASAEMNLPPLGRIDPPVRTDSRAPESAAAEGQEDLDALANTPATESTGLLERPPEPELPADTGNSAPPVAVNTPSPEKLTLERQLTSPVLWRASTPMASLPAGSSMSLPPMDGVSPVPVSPPPSGLGAELHATVTPAVRAERLPTQKLLLPKGAFLDCTLETAIDSTLPGLATCVMATDIFSSDGSVVLLERGTKLVGEVKSDVRAGQARVFVLWNEARTPQGIVVALASPATDALGRSGIPGAVDTHFDERFGAAILVSVIEGTIQALVASQQQSSGTAVVVSPEGSSQIATEILKSTVAIPPTIRVAQGTRVQVLVARDVDFRSVYALIAR